MKLRPIAATLLAIFLVGLLVPEDADARRKRRRRTRRRPIPVLTPRGLPNVQARSALVLDLDTNEVLYARRPREVRAIASLSKLTAVMVVLDHKLPLEKTTTITESDRRIARGGAKSRHLVGMTFTNLDLLHAALMVSDNRAVPALGRAVGLTPAQLVRKMNAKARALGLKRTRFKGPTGLSHDNRSTTREQIVTLQAALRYPLMAQILHKGTHTNRVVGGLHKGRPIPLMNTNRVVRSSRYRVLGGKTGFNAPARYCLVIAAKVAGRTVGMAFLGTEGKYTRFGDFSRVVTWLEQKKAGTPSKKRTATAKKVAPSKKRPAAPARKPKGGTQPEPSRKAPPAAPEEGPTEPPNGSPSEAPEEGPPEPPEKTTETKAPGASRPPGQEEEPDDTAEAGRDQDPDTTGKPERDDGSDDTPKPKVEKAPPRPTPPLPPLRPPEPAPRSTSSPPPLSSFASPRGVSRVY